jgi:hypothetical protein
MSSCAPAYPNRDPIPDRNRSARQGWRPGTVRSLDIAPDGQHSFTVGAAGQAQSEASTRQIQVVLDWFDQLKARVPTTMSTSLDAMRSIGRMSTAAFNRAAAFGIPYTALLAWSCAIV